MIYPVSRATIIDKQNDIVAGRVDRETRRRYRRELVVALFDGIGSTPWHASEVSRQAQTRSSQSVSQ